VLAWILGRLAVATLLLAGWVALAEPERWLELPRERPGLWLAVMVLYPLLSVVPQELLYRCFFFRRYRSLWGEGRGAVLASALAFGWAHVVFLSWISVLLTLAGGWILARTFERTRSLPLVALEHALYGCLVFTVGLGRHFYAPL
jgi:membrane protease YdiL (CAAX protease family)